MDGSDVAVFVARFVRLSASAKHQQLNTHPSTSAQFCTQAHVYKRACVAWRAGARATNRYRMLKNLSVGIMGQ